LVLERDGSRRNLLPIRNTTNLMTMNKKKCQFINQILFLLRNS
jgi:hypothetical protein